MDRPSDHDLLIAHSVKIDALCALTKSIDKKLGTFADKLDLRCVTTHATLSETHREIFDKIDTKTNDTTFRWLVGAILVIVMAFASMAGTCVVNTGINSRAILHMEKSITSLEQDNAGL